LRRGYSDRRRERRKEGGRIEGEGERRMREGGRENSILIT
jgi:hypothetical protein